MKIGIVSDTHDRLESIDFIKRKFQAEAVEMIFHCGDWVAPFTMEYFDKVFADFQVPVKSVFGNNEGDIKRILERNTQLTNPIEFAPKDVFELSLENQNYAIYHGHDKPTLNALINSQKYQAIFTGHTHEVRNETLGNTLVLNPGSTSFSAKSKIIEEASVAIFDSGQKKADIVKFKKRDLTNLA